MDIQSLLPVLQMVLTFGNVCIMGYALIKFLNKPHDSLEERVKTLELKLMETDQRLLKGNDKFREHDETNQILIRSTLALVEFEMQYCLIEHKDMSDGLRQAKQDLNEFLARK